MFNKDEFFSLFCNSIFNENKIIITENITRVLDFLNLNYAYDILKEIIAVDNQDGGTELIYNLYSTANEENLYISKTAYGETETVTDIYPSAIADENEIYDLFGVKFTNNKDLKRLYLPDTWEGFPLRKDYVQDDTRLAWDDNNDA